MSDYESDASNATPTLPQPPGLQNADPAVGPLVPYQVLVFPFPGDRQRRWAVKEQIGLKEDRYEQRLLAVEELLRRLPTSCEIELIPLEEHPEQVSVGIAIASNATAEDLARAEDVGYIKKTMKIMRTNRSPYWTETRT